MAKSSKNNPAGAAGSALDGMGSVLSTVSAPSSVPPPADAGGSGVNPELVSKTAAAAQFSAATRQNENKGQEYGEAARTTPAGVAHKASLPSATGSTVSEINASDKTGASAPVPGVNQSTGSLDRLRVDSAGQVLTTNQGVPVADNQHSLKIGLRGPTALEDFILREKITHFDHERIPERVVHARGSAAHGFFESYQDLSDLTRAAPFAAKGKRTPVFVRFSTVAGERGSADSVRDVRGFAVKFYTDEGNWDLVGNNMPVFFIQDAMKFPDLVHAVKPEPHHAMPQASSAHDTYWDFVSLMPESVHMQLWQMSDRAIPRSYRMMQGFGVHTFRLVNQEGVSVFCKFHWTPKLGTHSMVWDEAAKVIGADPDFHRRDLWEAIEAGAYPEWELGLQVFTEEQADGFGFDVLDATKLVPEELVPVQPVGRMVLDRNPDNFFAETEQVAFCTAHIVPGIDFSNDPLLQGRIHSYLDTQISRLGGVNFHEIPINAPLAQVHNNQRDGMHRQGIARGRVAYEPNSLGGGCPFQGGSMKGFTSFPQHISEDKVRGNPELFADHYSQARLFWQSQSSFEKEHIIKAFRFELSRVQIEAIRERVISQLVNVDEELAGAVAMGLGIPVPAAAPVHATAPVPQYAVSPALSLLAFPGDGSIKTRRIAVLVANGVDADTARTVYQHLLVAGAVPRFVGPRLGKIVPQAEQGEPLAVDVSLEAGPSVLYDAVVIPDGEKAVAYWKMDASAMDFIKEQYRHGKPMLVVGDAAALLEKAEIDTMLPAGGEDEALVVCQGGALEKGLGAFVKALAAHRQPARETDPPLV